MKEQEDKKPIGITPTTNRQIIEFCVFVFGGIFVFVGTIIQITLFYAGK